LSIIPLFQLIIYIFFIKLNKKGKKCFNREHKGWLGKRNVDLEGETSQSIGKWVFCFREREIGQPIEKQVSYGEREKRVVIVN